MADVRDVARFFIALGERQYEAGMGDLVTPLRLQKLLYFAQGWHLARHGKPLFSNKIEAWEHGPVVREIYGAYRQFEGRGITGVAAPEESTFAPEEYETMLDVSAEYDKHSTWALVDMTHEPNAPWLTTEQNQEITTQRIKAYFDRQPRLKTVDDIIASFDPSHIITPLRYENGVAVLPAEAREKLGAWND